MNGVCMNHDDMKNSLNNLEKKMDMVITMVADMNERMTEGFARVDERFEQVDARMDRMDERFDQMDARMDKMDERFDRMDARLDKMDERFDKLEDKLETLREENAKEHDILRGQIGAVAEALNISNAMHDAQLNELKERMDALELAQAESDRVQDQHSIDIMKLRAAI